MRELGPNGIHVAYVVIDGVIDMPFACQWLGDSPADLYVQPDDIAGEIYHVAHQSKSARSWVVALRPFGES